jgi:hypothetical protein
MSITIHKFALLIFIYFESFGLDFQTPISCNPTSSFKVSHQKVIHFSSRQWHHHLECKRCVLMHTAFVIPNSRHNDNRNWVCEGFKVRQ